MDKACPPPPPVLDGYKRSWDTTEIKTEPFGSKRFDKVSLCRMVWKYIRFHSTLKFFIQWACVDKNKFAQTHYFNQYFFFFFLRIGMKCFLTMTLTALIFMVPTLGPTPKPTKKPTRSPTSKPTRPGMFSWAGKFWAQLPRWVFTFYLSYWNLLWCLGRIACFFFFFWRNTKCSRSLDFLCVNILNILGAAFFLKLF